MKRLLATLAILRPHNMLATGACVACGYHLTGGGNYQAVLIPSLVTALVTGLGNLINDYYDADIDRVNRPRRPIPSGRLSAEYVRRVYWAGTVIITPPMIAMLPVRLWLLMLGWEIMLFLYAYSGKRIPLLGNLLISAIVASAFVAGAMLTGHYRLVAFPVAFAFLLVMGRELVKGAEDIHGDRLAGASTLAVRLGAEKAVAWASLPLFLCVLAAPLPGLAQLYGRPYTFVVELACVPGILIAVYVALRSPQTVALHRPSRILKLGMLFGIAAIALARV